MEKTYKIIITGSGTREQIINALLFLKSDIYHADNLDKKKFEDRFLYTEIERGN